MSSRILAILTLAALLGLPAAAQRPAFLWQVQQQAQKHPPVPGRPEEPEQACPKWRWIGIKADPCAPCPKPQERGWTVRPLFSEPDRGQKSPPLGLRSFCLYEHRGSGGTLTTAGLPGLLAVDQDCMVVLPAAPPTIAREALQPLEDRFLRHARNALPAPAGPARVRLALLDTAPDSEDPGSNPDNNSPHGYSLATMAKKLACAGADCAARVTSRLALPRVRYDPLSGAASQPDTVRGGFVGTQGDLAQAIRTEVVAWQAPGQPSFLVLNLSLGWNSRFGGLEADLSTARSPVQAVHAALVDAVCRGVQVVAAAGNRTWGPIPERSRGPLLPAAWESRQAPVPAVCVAALSPGGSPVTSGVSAYRPLVHAVGAVRSTGEPLGNARLDAEPRLVAFGDHAVVKDRSGKPTALLTGSSVSTMLVSTRLARVRHLRPNLDAFAAVDRLYQSGQDRARPASFCLGASDARSCPGVRHIYVAEDLQTAPSSPGPPFSLAQIFASAETVDVKSLRPANPLTNPACPPGAWIPWLSTVREQLFLRSAAPRARCPRWQFFDTNLQAAIGPQPGSNPCSTCALDPGGGGTATAYIEIDDYTGQLSSAVLTAGANSYALGDLQPGTRLVVEGLPAVPVEAVQLSFQVNENSSATSLFFVQE